MLAVYHDTFDPVLLSLEENAFLLEHVGKPPAVVARVPPPIGVNLKAVMPVIEKVYQLDEIQKHDKEVWVGVETIRAKCQTYLEQKADWARMKARAGGNFPTSPTMSAWDAHGKSHVGGTGSDSQRVRTYFDANGERQPLAVSLHDHGVAFKPPWIKNGVVYDALNVDEQKGSMSCPICNHTDTYDTASQSAKNAASARMARHLTSAKKDVDAHRALHIKVFG